MYIERHRRREIVQMSLITPPHVEGYASYLAALQTLQEPEIFTAAPGDESAQLPTLRLLKSLDDLDEEADEDDDDIEDLDDEEDEDELDEDYEDDEDEEDEEDEDEDEDEDEEEDEDEDGGVKPLKMSSYLPGSFPTRN
jgi:hypothetical protein